VLLNYAIVALAFHDVYVYIWVHKKFTLTWPKGLLGD